MKNMDFDKLVEDYLKNLGETIDFDTAFEIGAKWAKDLLSSHVKDDYISPEDRKMIYEMAGRLILNHRDFGLEYIIKECYETAKRLYLLTKQEL
jgi:hypothetical protein